MFLPNLKGSLTRREGYTSYAEPMFGAAVDCPFSAIRMNTFVKETNRRADSSASRGSAYENQSDSRIMVPAYITIKAGDQFHFNGVVYDITGVHPRYTVSGTLDHFDCMMDPVPPDED